MKKSLLVRRSLALCLLLASAAGLPLARLPAAAGSDWPMWRFDARRGGGSPEELPAKLELQWVLELPAPRPAWPSNQAKLLFDRVYEPVLMGSTLFVPSMITDSVTAYDTATGRKRWTFHAGGPVRFAPVAWHERVYFTSDDGHLYCLDARDGSLVWKFRGGPSDRKILGNDRLVSAWPARGAPVIRDGIIYFGASVWPLMGIFLHALDADTGEVVWTNSGTGSRYTTQQHNSPAFAGIAPQGYIAATEDRLIVAGGRTLPAVFDRKTGAFLHYNLASRKMGSKGGGGYEVIAAEDFYINRGKLYRMKDGTFVTSVDALIVTPNAVIGKDPAGICGYLPHLAEVKKKDRKGKETKSLVLKKSWITPLDEKIATVFIMSGSRLYATTSAGEVVAVDLPRLDRGAGISWRVRLPDTPLNMITGDGRLFISTDAGRIYCFGGGEKKAPIPRPEPVTLVPRAARWRILDDGSDQGTAWREPVFDDSAWRAGRAPVGYGDPVTTEVSFGSDAKKKRTTCYFRRAFEVPRGRRVAEPAIRLRVDDGAVVYVNGKEVARKFMPKGEVKYTTLAKSGTDEKSYYELQVPAASLRGGRNVIAVEVHQRSPGSSDLLFDLELTAKLDTGGLSRTRLADVIEPSPLARPIVDALEAGIPAGPEREGWCVALGIGSGSLIESIAALGGLHVIAVDPDAARVAGFRKRLDALGAYGTPISAVAGDPLDAGLPPYLATLVIAEDPAAAGIDRGEAFVRSVFRLLRPYTGAAILRLPAGDDHGFERAVAAAGLDGGSLERRGDLLVLRRRAPPAGSGSWTHQNGDASNRVSSDELNVRAPLGVLWFGGPSNEGVLPRHGHGPTPQVAGGRLVIEGRNMLRATDIYTGRLLWEHLIKDVGKYYDYTSHEPGANALGSNYVTLEDAVYVVHGTRCRRLDPATGAAVAELTLPRAAPSEPLPEWGYIGVWKDILVAGARPLDAGTPDFQSAEFAGLRDAKNAAKLKRRLRQIEVLRDFDPAPRKAGQHDVDYFVENLNRLLYGEGFLDHIPSRVRKRAKARAIEKELRRYVGAVRGRRESDLHALFIKRRLLEKYYGLPAYQRKPPGKFGSLKRMASKRLVALDRRDGSVLWEREAAYQIRHNAIALGAGKAFYLDRIPDSRRSYFRRRGLKIDEHASITALDIRDGTVLWTASENIFGTWLGYSAEHDVLLQAGSAGRDRARDEVSKGIIAYRGSTGHVLWRDDEKYAGPLVLLGRWAITQGTGTPAFALDLETGAPRMRPHPVTGEPVRWGYTRNHGCNTALGCPNLLTFRSAAAGYFDLAGDSGTGNFGGFRAGCTSNLIPAGGILSAPDYTRTCTCSYQNQASLALVHMPDIEMWTFSPYTAGAGPVERAGINFGAPGDRRGPDGTLWLDSPSVGGRSPDVPLEVLCDSPVYHRHHPSAIESGPLPWVASSAVEAGGEIAIRLRAPGRFRIPNEVAGGSALAVAHGTRAVRAPAASVPLTGAPNASSLGSTATGKETFEAEVAADRALAAASVTVELWVRVAADLDYVDARVGSPRKEQGFVLDNRKLRVRYFVANAAGTDNERAVTITSKKPIADGTWTHVAFTYDAESGTGAIFIDGVEVGRHDGPDGRPLWWDRREPRLRVGAGLKPGAMLDELRISDAALPPDAFLRSRAGPAAGSGGGGAAAATGAGTIGYWRMERTGGIVPGRYTVRLVFAETELLRPGERVFDVSLQGRRVLDDLDIAARAGGPRRAIVEEFRNVPVEEHLRIELTPVRGARPLLSGVEVIARSREL